MARMLPDGRRLGAHLGIGDGMVKAADRAAEIGAAALQVFSDNPTAWHRRAEPSPEILAFRSSLEANDVAPLVIHASYLINLAGSDPTFHARSVELLAAELDAARRFGARIVNVHVGSHRGSGPEAGIERLASGIAAALAADDAERVGAVAPDDEGMGRSGSIGPVIALENSSGGGWGLGVDLPEWVAIAGGLEAAGVPTDRLAFCLDLAHLWAAGIDVGTPAVIDDLVAAFDGELGIERLALIHLNDTKSELGSRMDRHEHLGAGRIGPDGLGHVLRHERLRGATYILETPGMEEGYDAVNLARAEALARGEPLEPLPPEAFALRRRRSHATADEPVPASTTT
jgi:deoxyribonuclease-4